MAEETAIETEAPAEETRPEWLPENFKTPEDLAKSYSEAERKIHELAAEAKEKSRLEAENEQMREWIAQQEAQRQQAQAGDPRERFLEVWEDPDRQAELVLHMAGQIADLAQRVESHSSQGPDPALTEISAQYAQQAIEAKFPDWGDYAEQVSEAVAANPQLLGLSDNAKLSDLTRGLESVYWMVKGQSLSTPEGQAAADAAEAARVAKQAAITQSGSSTRPPTLTDDEQYAQRIRDAAKNSGGYGS